MNRLARAECESGRKRSRAAALPHTRAFTLVELLVVIFVVTLLVALLLPAVMASREASRRAACTSNLRQLGVGVELFGGVHGRFPPGRFKGRYGTGILSQAWSWIAVSLPYVEQDSIYDTGDIPDATLQESGVVHMRIDVLLCPSGTSQDHASRLDAGNLSGYPVGPTNYKAVSGANWGDDAGAMIATNWRLAGVGIGPPLFDGLENGDGLMWRNDHDLNNGPADVQDGLSNTWQIGEDLPTQNQWCSWAYANNAYGTCAIPPNYRHFDPSEWENTWSFRSRHPRGLNFCLADGSVRFVSETIDLQVYRALATRRGNENAVLAP